VKIALIGEEESEAASAPTLANYFHRGGSEVVACWGPPADSPGSSFRAWHYGINAAPHTDFNRMLKEVQPDAVAIASRPPPILNT